MQLLIVELVLPIVRFRNLQIFILWDLRVEAVFRGTFPSIFLVEFTHHRASGSPSSDWSNEGVEYLSWRLWFSESLFSTFVDVHLFLFMVRAHLFVFAAGRCFSRIGNLTAVRLSRRPSGCWTRFEPGGELPFEYCPQLFSGVLPH